MQRAAALALLLAGACVPSDGPSMRPFEDCIGCHSGSEDARAWTVAGTWARGATITLVDSRGKTLTLRGNDVGNFYTAEGLVFPLTVSVNGRLMADSSTPGVPIRITYGGCNVCHRAEAVTIGPLMAPGSDCLTCHGPGGMATSKFSAAGTWGSTTGTSVTFGGATTGTNAVGNFAFCAPGNPCTFQGVSYGKVAPLITSPTTVKVGTQTMTNLTYGGCNRCHGRGGNAGGD